MKKSFKITLSIVGIFVILIVISLIMPGGKLFWNQLIIIPIIKPLSEPCGFGGTTGMQVKCQCSGSIFADHRLGSTNYYCTDSCSQCKCYSTNFTDSTKAEVDCNNFSQLDWAFPLEKTAPR